MTVLLAALLLAVPALLGEPVPDWPVKPAERWAQGAPATLSELRGKVVLLRFFTDRSCPYCSATAPALRQFDREFSAKGLVVIGIYTPKPEPRPVDVAEVRALAREYGFGFRVLVDDDWGALRTLWLDRVPDAEFTSASLLIDRRGILRHAQEGGTYAKDSDDPNAREDFKRMHEAIAKLVAER